MLLPKLSDLVSYCLQYRLPKNISRREEQTIKFVTGRLQVKDGTLIIVCQLYIIFYQLPFKLLALLHVDLIIIVYITTCAFIRS